jgi:ABC-2 type transport system permease protein
VTALLADYAEFGDYLLRLGLSWLFLTFLSFLAFSGIVTALSTFFLADDLRLLFAGPRLGPALFHARFLRTVAQSSWMVVVFVVPVLMGVGLAHCAPAAYYPMTIVAVAPFVMIPIAIGTAVTLPPGEHLPGPPRPGHPDAHGAALRRQPGPAAADDPARAAAAGRVAAGHHGLLRHAAVAGDAAPAVVLGRGDRLRRAPGALRHPARRRAVDDGAGADRPRRGRLRALALHGFSKAQEGRKVRFTKLAILDRVARVLPISTVHRHLLVKDLKLFLRDVSQWSQLLLLLALVLVYLYNFRVLDLDKIPYMSGMVKNVYAFVNLAMAGLVMSTVCARFVFRRCRRKGRRSGSSGPRRSRSARSCGRSSGPACCRCFVLTEG